MFGSSTVLAVIGSFAGLVFAQSADQYWHERYHGILSMAAYGDYNTLCPNLFTVESLRRSFPGSTARPWEVIEEWGPLPRTGIKGFSVVIPEMDKVVLVFRGQSGWEAKDRSPASLNGPLSFEADCVDCTAHAGALDAYLEVREHTQNWQIHAAAVLATGYQWSITGHGFGGMVAQIASLDLGWRGLCHWTHNHGSPRVLSPNAAARYNSLFEGEAGQRVIANGDSVPGIISDEHFAFTRQGIHVYGTNTTAGSFFGHMNWEIKSYADNQAFAGGSVRADHDFYYTPIGTCGASVRPDPQHQESIRSSEDAMSPSTATSLSSTASANSTTTTTSTMTSTSTTESATDTTSTTVTTDAGSSSMTMVPLTQTTTGGGSSSGAQPRPTSSEVGAGLGLTAGAPAAAAVFGAVVAAAAAMM